MRFQTQKSHCGPAALVNALRCLDEVYEVGEVVQACRTTDDGTDPKNLRLAIRRLGFRDRRILFYNNEDAWHALRQALRNWPVILCVDKEKHWVTAIGKVGKRINIFDPGRWGWNKKEHGILVLSRERLIKRWRTKKGEFYGVVVMSSKSG